jgi:Predicted membrane protein
MSAKCTSCGAMNNSATTCEYCGASLQIITNTTTQGAQQVVKEVIYVKQQPQAEVFPGTSNKMVAGILGIFLGGLGIHKFYLGKIAAGVLYCLFCWTFIPALIGFIEGVIYLCMSDDEFNRKFNR